MVSAGSEHQRAAERSVAHDGQRAGKLWRHELYRSLPGAFFAGMGFGSGSTAVFWDMDPSPSISQSSFNASPDPLASLFLGSNHFSPLGGLSGI
jgi:hypothetical protein